MSQYLDLDGAASSGASTPDHADFTVTDLDIRCKIAFDTYTTKAQRPTEKWGSGTEQQFLLQIEDDGVVLLQWHDGTTTQSLQISTPGWTDVLQYWLKATLDVDHGSGDWDLKIYRSTDTTDDHTAVSFSRTFTRHAVTAMVLTRADGLSR